MRTAFAELLRVGNVACELFLYAVRVISLTIVRLTIDEILRLSWLHDYP